MIEPGTLKLLLRHEPETGKLFWKERTADMFSETTITAKGQCAIWNGQRAGKEAFTSSATGYKLGRICGRSYSAHRVIWALHYGVWPTKEIDHINGVKSDNRISNLREASRSENARNAPMRTTNKSGVKGVCWVKNSQKWLASITIDGKQHSLGLFKDKNAAAMAYAKASAEMHGEFGRT